MKTFHVLCTVHEIKRNLQSESGRATFRSRKQKLADTHVFGEERSIVRFAFFQFLFPFGLQTIQVGLGIRTGKSEHTRLIQTLYYKVNLQS